MPSPRTPEHPAAFTRGELLFGALRAVLWFLGSSTLFYALTMQAAAVFALIYSVPFSLGAAVVGTPLAALIGFALRGVRARWIHLAVFALYGLAVGFAAVRLFDALNHGFGLTFTTLGLVTIALAGGSVALGRQHAFARADRLDAPPTWPVRVAPGPDGRGHDHPGR
ncbi:hypothetical protein GCM10022219_21450 [Microbacterium oryzae]|uniref:Uncharacterized protein n=1 Tax=Microbacterium oryzae TaxID=743009 RepID=A0A6I6E4B2_9MICO|nr:hypothetical protein [Microbacterium oryzae]QGU27617.1 hypothetical protein D7D94_08015 [Microbacterium oryzae]